MTLTPQMRTQIDDTLREHPVVLFMKGRRRMPQCGFSARVVELLDQFLPEYHTINVLESQEIREGMKVYSEWPTFPQLYVRGQFVGGADIVGAMYESGELAQVLGAKVEAVAAPNIQISALAAEALLQTLRESGEAAVRVIIDPNFRTSLDLDAAGKLDLQLSVGGVPLVMDRATAQRAAGLSIDFVAGEMGGFKIENPNEPPRVKGISASELKRRMDAREGFELIDVRTPDEYATARILGAKLMDEAVREYLDGLSKDTVLVFMCHSGQRSAAAAQRYLGQGFKRVYNLMGGIDAWSREVDPKVPRY